MKRENLEILKEWFPLIISVSILIGTAFIVTRDVAETKDRINKIEQISIDQGTSLTRHDEQLKAISHMQDDIRRLTNYIMNNDIFRRRN